MQRNCVLILSRIHYLLVLCGLLLGLLIGGYCPQLRAAGLTYDTDVSADSAAAAEQANSSGSDSTDESDQVYQNSTAESTTSDSVSTVDDNIVDSSGSESNTEDSSETGDADTDYTIDISIDYEALTESITEAIVAAVSSDAAALEESSYDGSISSTYLSLFAGIYLKYAAPTDDYLLYRADQYTYNLVIGDLDLSSTTFSGSDCIIISIYSRTSTGYTPTYTVYTDDILITADNYYCFSNLGDFAPIPDLAKLLYEQMIIFALIFVGIMVFVHGLIIFRKGD